MDLVGSLPKAVVHDDLQHLLRLVLSLPDVAASCHEGSLVLNCHLLQGRFVRQYRTRTL